MVSHLIYFLLAFLASTQALLSTPSKIIELFSEGARSPLTNYDPSWSNLGMLTSLGFRQHYILGKVLSDKYPSLLANTYDDNQVYVLSSNLSRSIQSVGAHFYGMYLGDGPALPSAYPPEKAIPAYKDANAIPIANSLSNSEALPHKSIAGVIFTADETNQIIFSGDQSLYCPNLASWTTQNINDPTTQDTFKSLFQETINNLNSLLPQDLEVKASNDILEFGDMMFANLYDNRALPGGINDPALIKRITWAYTWVLYRLTQGQQIQRELSAFHLVNEFINRLSSFRQGKSSHLANFYSGHSSNLFALLSAFGVINEQCIIENFKSVLANGAIVHPNCRMVSFASNIVIEFYNETITPYVKLYYDNVALSICNGKYECPYDEFVVFARGSVGNNTRDSYFSQCTANLPQNKEERIQVVEESGGASSRIFLATEISTNVVMAIVCLLLIFFIVWNKRKFVKEMAMRTKVGALDQAVKQKKPLEIKT